MPRFHALSFCFISAISLPLAAQEDAFEWDNSTEFSYVATAGNASSSTLGLKSTLTGEGGGGTFKLDVGGIRASSNFTTRTAVGTSDDFMINEETRTEQSAANYFARSRYDHELDGWFAFGGGGWERNTFAGVDHRYSLVSGVGKAWVDSDTDVAVLTFVPTAHADMPLTTEEAAETRAIIDAMEGSKRLLIHGRAIPTLDGDIERIPELAEKWRIAAWKTYTQYGPGETGWWLDDDELGTPFIEAARATGVHTVARRCPASSATCLVSQPWSRCCVVCRW